MDKGWLELESDPGLFTLLLEDFGVEGVQVEEIYDLQKSIEGTVYGFIFLFKWIEERRSRRKIIQENDSFVVDEDIVNNMFFAKQVIPNSCATHALLSVLLNCGDKVKLGDTLSHLKDFTKNIPPEDKGFAIGNLPELARAHNSHARPEAPRRQEKQQGISAAIRTMEAFHFVSYVSINGRLFELDGLRPYPVDHGPWGENEEWTEKFRRVISERLGMATGGEPYHDIRFNLMAVVPDRRQQYEHKLHTLKTNRQIVLEALQQMVKVTNPDGDGSGRGLRGKAEPIMTRSVAAAAREALATHQAEKAAAAAAVAAANSSEPAASHRTRNTRKASTSVSSSVTSPISTPSATSPSGTRLPGAAVLDCHSYAKSPIMDGEGGDEQDGESDIEEIGESLRNGEEDSILSTASGEKMMVSQLQGDQLTTVKDNAVKIEISVSDDNEGSVTNPTTVATTDVTKPLIIQTKFAMHTSPGPGSESTDTASEVGSLLSSPAGSSTTSAHSSPNTSFLKQLANRSELEVLPEKLEIGQEALLRVKAELEGQRSLDGRDGKLCSQLLPGGSDGSREDEDEKISPNSKSKFSSTHGFTPKDLLALLKNVENEISTTEKNLRDEVEKREKYKIDDCRRTHNYDQFVCTFLSMLAEQGHLAGLVEQHMLIKRRQGVNVGSLNKKIKKSDKRRRSKPKKKR